MNEAFFRDFENHKFEKLILISIFLYPVFLSTLHHWGSSFTFLLVMLSALHIRKSKLEYGFDKNYFYLYVLLIFLSLVSFVNSSDVFRSWRSLEVFLYFFAMFLFVPVIRSIGSVSMKYLVGGFAASGVATAIYSIFHQGGPLTGAYHHIFLGEVSAISSVVLFGCVLHKHFSNGWFAYYLSGFACSLYVCVLSGSRGAWLGALLAMLLTVILYGKALFHRRNIFLMAFVVTLILLVFVIKKDFVVDRINKISSDINLYQAETPQKTSSLGARFLMWSVAYETWKTNPLIGSGLGDFQDDLKRAIDNKDIPFIPAYSQAHSLYMDFLSCVGLLGTLSMISFVFIYPGYVLFRRFADLSDDNRYLAVIGLSCLVAFAVFGLSDSWLNKRAMVSLYVVVVSVFVFGISLLAGVNHSDSN